MLDDLALVAAEVVVAEDLVQHLSGIPGSHAAILGAPGAAAARPSPTCRTRDHPPRGVVPVTVGCADRVPAV
ncbi:hypothetical protein PSU4_03650 [Pseudonocardia sulfidoxydans NBRC 16205]|uniref:Uncharacterized protein n=1 Tax=Pseudonocardia sulfidoxydans NBRC 16205 TaxID=1223511 RepID=A0A511D9E3_9PSEU|nr:hypothetical protein PSU4_03650 [Pseudonocardia sulfidoxydans NBRC 16205]